MTLNELICEMRDFATAISEKADMLDDFILKFEQFDDIIDTVEEAKDELYCQTSELESALEMLKEIKGEE